MPVDLEQVETNFVLVDVGALGLGPTMRSRGFGLVASCSRSRRQRTCFAR